MDLHEAMRGAPTSRRFTDRPVAPEAIRRALDSARFAPSGGNRQGWRVVVVRDAKRRRAIRDLYLPHWKRYLEETGGARMLREPGEFDPSRVRMVERADGYAQRLDEVPVHLLVGVRIDDLVVTDSELPRESIVGGASVYPFVQNLLLALRAEELGAALTTLLVPAEAEVRRLLRCRATWRSRRTSASATAPTRGRAGSRAGRSSSSRSPSASASRCSAIGAGRLTAQLNSTSGACASGTGPRGRRARTDPPGRRAPARASSDRGRRDRPGQARS